MQYKIVDLFAGIGGIRLGFEQGIPHLITVASSEINKFANRTYEANFPKTPNLGDITTLVADDVPDHDILLGGFPCQPFSQAGNRLGFEDTRGTVFYDILRILRIKRPAMLMLENVAGLMSHDKGNTVKIIKNELVKAGYGNLYIKKLKAKDFGLPQLRERTYIVAFFDQSIKFEFPTPPCTPTRVGDILESNVDKKYTISDRAWAGHIERKQKNMAKGKGFGYSLVHEESYFTNTILKQYYKDGKSVLIDQGDDKNPRKLTPRECARLQGFPDSFTIPVSDTQAYQQFGNSVAIPVIKAIATKMMLAHATEFIIPDGSNT